jgi:hypothetical protein
MGNWIENSFHDANSGAFFFVKTFPACLFCKASFIVNDKGRYHSRWKTPKRPGLSPLKVPAS